MMPSPAHSATSSPQHLLALALALGIALATLAASATVVGAQGPGSGPTEHWRLADTWRDQPAATTVTALEWPAGHVPGGLGADWIGGQVFACDRTAGHVRIYDWRGAFLGLLEGPDGQPWVFDEPRDVATYYLDADDPSSRRVMVSEGGGDRVRVLDASGAVLETHAVRDPFGLLVADGERLVVSRARKHIRLLGRTAPDGANLVIDLPGAVAPERVEADYRGGDDVSLLVADPGLDGLLAVRERGVEPWLFGRVDPLPGLSGLTAVPAVDPRGELRQYVLAAGQGGLVQVDDDARSDTAIPFDRAHDVALYFSGNVDRIFATVEPQGLVLLGELDDVLRYTARSLQTFTALRRVAVDRLVALGEDSPRVQILRSSGSVLGRAQLSTWPAPRLPVRDVATAAGSVYLLTGTYGGSLTQLVLNGSGTGIELGPWGWRATQTRILTAVDANAHGQVALLDALNQEAVLLDLTGGASERTISLRTPEFRGVLDLALGAERIFLADQQRSAVEAWTLQGQHLWTSALEGNVQSVSAGADGDVFALATSGWISHLDRDGTLRGEWPAGTPAERPADLAHGSDGRVYVVDHLEDLRIYAQDAGDPPPPAHVTGESPCRLRGDKAAAPAEIQLGEEVEVSLLVDGRCPVERIPADVVLVIDRSGSMSGEKIIAARDAAFTFAARTDPDLVRVAIVSFASDVTVAHPLANPSRQAVAQALGGLQAGGGTRIAPALEAALGELAGARSGVKRVIVLLSDGLAGRSASEAVAARARADGIQIYTIGLGGDADPGSLIQIAGDAARYHFAPSAFDLLAIYGEIARRVEADVLFRRATLVDRVPDNMDYVTGSAQPTAATWDPAARTLTWSFENLPEPGFRLRYRLRPQEAGTHPTNLSAEVDFTDGFGHGGRVVMPVPTIRVLAAGAPTATPWTPPPTPAPGTATPATDATPTSIPRRTPTPTPTRASSATSTATPTATPDGPTTTPGPLSQRIYLPIQLSESCTEMRRLVDVVLVLDASTSMRDTRNAAGMSRLEAAYMAADRFVRHLVMPGDRAAVVSFNDRAELLQGLTGEQIYVRAALLRITPRMQTRLDLGIATAREELAANGRSHVERAIVVLTDGLANPVPMDVAVAEADAARALGITIHAVGLGHTIDEPGLRRVAGHPSRYHHATDDDDLAALYSRIASRLPCPGRWFWGRRP